MASTNQDADAPPAPSALDDILERAVGAVRDRVVDRETTIYGPDAVVEPKDAPAAPLDGGAGDIDSAAARLPPPKRLPSVVERYGHASPDPGDVFPIATGSPRKRQEGSVLAVLEAAAEAAGPGEPVSLPVPPATGPEIRGPRRGTTGDGPLPGSEPAPRRVATGPVIRGPRIVLEPEEELPGPTQIPTGPSVRGPRMVFEGDEVDAPARPPSGPSVSGPRMVFEGDEVDAPARPPSGPSVRGPRMASDGRTVEDGPPAPAVGPTVRGPRMGASGDRPMADDDAAPPPPGDPTVGGGGRLSVSPDRPMESRASNPTMEGAVSFPPPAPAWARRSKGPVAPPEAPVPGLEVERPRAVEVLGEPGPDQRDHTRITAAGRDQVRRRLDFQHQRFELVRVRRPRLQPPGDAEPVLSAWPVYLSESAPIGNGLLAQIIAARFSDHDSTDSWARVMVRLGIGASPERLSEAIVAASTHVAPIWQALHDDVLAGADRVDEGDLAARVPEGRQVREGRVRAVTAGPQVWYSWREADDLSPVLPRGSKAQAAGHRAFDLHAASAGRSRAGRWAKVRQRLHQLLPQDPDRAAYALHLAHRVRRADCADPDLEVLASAAGGLRRWLDARRREFDSPRSPLERVVVALLGEWSDLEPVDEAGNLSPPLHTLRTGRQSPVMAIDPREGPPEDVLAWHSLVESCHGIGERPWDYLHELLHAAAHGRIGRPADWTPARWAARSRG